MSESDWIFWIGVAFGVLGYYMGKHQDVYKKQEKALRYIGMACIPFTIYRIASIIYK